MKEFNWHLIRDFKHVKMSGPLTALYFSQIIQEVSGGLTSAFFAAFLFQQLGGSVVHMILYFLVSYTMWLFMIPFGAKLMERIGLKKSMMISIIFGAIYYGFLIMFFMEKNWLYLIPAIISVNINRMCFWIQYHTDFAKFSDPNNRGKQISLFASIASLVAIFLPILSGRILQQYDFGILFQIAVIIYSLSIIPLFLIPERSITFSFSYWECFRRVFCRDNWRSFLSYMCDGAQTMVGVVFWPLFIWLLLDKSYVAVGVVTSAVIFVSMIVRLTVGDFTDRIDKKKMIRLGTFLYAIGWIIKMFVATGFQVFAASTYHSFSDIVMRTSYDALMYERAANSGPMVDEYTVMREISFTLGRLVMIALGLIIFLATGNIAWCFVIAAIASLLINLI
jgi:MFS family permease